MTGLEQFAIFAAGTAAGAINTVVGSGTLITFPVLLAAGLPPVTANVSNTIGLVPGSLSGAIGYRRELAGQYGRVVRLGAASALGGLIGAVLLVTLPAGAFKAIVPVLIATALVLVVFQPRLSRALAARRGEVESESEARPAHGGPLLIAGLLACGVYGGYFGAAQGVLMMGLMGLLLDEDLQRMNAVKNVLALLVNGVAAVFFLAESTVDWRAAGLVAAGSVLGGQLGAVVGRRLPPLVLRGVIVVVGLVAIGGMLAS